MLSCEGPESCADMKDTKLANGEIQGIGSDGSQSMVIRKEVEGFIRTEV